MRYRILVIAAFAAVLAWIAPIAAYAQRAVVIPQRRPPAVDIKPVDDVVAEHFAKVDKENGEETDSTYVMGRISDFSGRSIRGADVALFSLDSNELVRRVTTTPFGYYRFEGLKEGEGYLISVQHRRFIFVGGSISFTIESTPIQIDFQAEEMR